MPYPASFSVEFQHPQADENTSYNTQPTFVVPGSKAAERNARRKKGSIPLLQDVPNRHWEVSGSIQSQYGLMTPETPDPSLMHVDSGNHYSPGQEDVIARVPRDFSDGFYPNYYARYVTVFILSNLLSDLDFQSSCNAISFQLLSHYPIANLYTDPRLEPIWTTSV